MMLAPILASACTPRVLVLGAMKPIGERLVWHAQRNGVQVVDHDADMVIGCQFEFWLDELRRTQHTSTPRLATLICPLQQRDLERAASQYGQREFQQLECTTGLLHTPMMSSGVPGGGGYTPDFVSKQAIEVSLAILKSNIK